MPQKKNVIEFIVSQSKDRELQNRLGALINTKVSQDNEGEFMESLLTLNSDLERCYEHLRACKAGSETEKRYFTRIKVLEETRFDLLQRINGQSIDRYSQHPIDVN